MFQKLILSGDLSVETLGPAEASDLWSQKSWGAEAHWVMLTPAGDLATTGPGQPRGEALLDALRSGGGTPRWEARAAFLKDNPDQGEAHLEAVSLGFRLMRTRLMGLDRQGKVKVPAWHPETPNTRIFASGRVSLPPGPEGETLAEDLASETAKALARLFGVPGWAGALPSVSAQLSLWDVSQSSSMRAVFAEVADKAEALLRQDPGQYDLANFWMEANEAAGRAPALLGGHFTAVPGSVWPTPAILNRLLEPYRRRQDWEGLMRCVADLTPTGAPEPMTRRGWDEYCRLQCALLVQRGIALASQGAWDLASGSLDDARQWGGGQGVRETVLLRGGQWAGAPADQVQWRTLLNQALAKEGPRRAMPPLAPPLRLVVMGSPKWMLEWSQLNKAADLLPWSPGELRWEAASQEAHLKFQRQFGWAPGPRWALFRGESLSATGQACPNPRALASLLEGEGSTMLQQLTRVIDGQPDHLAARRARFALLLKRMPEPRLEPTLARDAAAARIPLEFDPAAPWKPDLDLWAGAAQEVLPKAEEELRGWPNRSALWTLWISWARFHPAHPSILALAQGLPYWFPQGDWRSSLPYQVQRAVAAELLRQGRFDTMRTWFGAAWDALDRRPLASLRFGEREWVLMRRKEEETAIFQPLRDALRALRCTHEQMDLERVFSGMIGQDVSRRR